MGEIYLVKLDKAVVNFEGENIASLEVYVPDKPKAVTDKEGRKQLEGRYDTKEEKLEKIKRIIKNLGKKMTLYGMRWPAGGLAYMTEDNYFIFLRRDERAPSYPNYLTIASGLGRSEDEIKFPHITILREGSEEIGIYNIKGNEILVPNISELAKNPILINIIKDNVEKHKKSLGVNDAKVGKYDMELAGELKKEVEINTKIDPNKFSGQIFIDPGELNYYDLESIHAHYLSHISSINIDPKTNGIDLLGIVKIPFKLKDFKEKYKIFDGEGFKRDIVLLPPEEAEKAIKRKPYWGFVIPYDGGIEKRKMNYPLTPVAITSIAPVLGEPTDEDIIIQSLIEWAMEMGQEKKEN